MNAVPTELHRSTATTDQERLDDVLRAQLATRRQRIADHKRNLAAERKLLSKARVEAKNRYQAELADCERRETEAQERFARDTADDELIAAKCEAALSVGSPEQARKRGR